MDDRAVDSSGSPDTTSGETADGITRREHYPEPQSASFDVALFVALKRSGRRFAWFFITRSVSEGPFCIVKSTP
jgi:hypothetical protein